MNLQHPWALSTWRSKICYFTFYTIAPSVSDFILAILFLVIGVIFLSKVKLFNYSKWRKIKCRIIIWISVNVFSLLFWGSVNFVALNSKFFDTLITNSINNDDWMFPFWLSWTFITEIFVPVSTQIFLSYSGNLLSWKINQKLIEILSLTKYFL